MVSIANENIVALIKKISMQAFNASKPCDTFIGTVVTLSPLKIMVGQQIPLESAFLDITCTANKRMEKGSRVLLLRQSGGQKYTVIDTLV